MGWSFPPTFDDKAGVVLMVADETDVEQSLQMLLSTRPGERVMQPQYGCNLDAMLFEPLTTTLLAYMKELIQTAILYYEPRITVDDVSIDTLQSDEGLVLIEVSYTIIASNSRYNMVYPFYIDEGSPT
ncbi:MAG TPA: GPW/gp25 family protein [Puia sp.]|nr:GPW/gp25 family protein [Puia sp.]